MRVLVTGAYGYIGMSLLHRLRLEDFELFGVGHAPRGSVQRPSFVEHIGDDLRTVSSYPRIDAAVHLAGGGGPAECSRHPIDAIRSIVGGTSEVLHIARWCEARKIVFTSTNYVYPSCSYALQETHKTYPDTIYGAAKVAAENVLSDGAPPSPIVLRLAHVYGNGYVRLDSVVDRFVRAAIEGKTVCIHGRGRRKLEYVHLSDVCEVILAALRNVESRMVVNFGTGELVSVRQVAEACGIKPRQMIYGDDSSPPKRLMDSSYAHDRLYKPKVKFADGIRRYVASLGDGEPT